MSIQTRIYAGGAFAFGQQQAVDNFLAAGYSAIVVWSVHVNTEGTLILNDTQFVSNGIYQEAEPMNLPARLAQLRNAGIQVIFSVGAGGTQDFTNIEALMGGVVPTQGNILYDNFAALKTAMMAVTGGDIDAIDFDNEDNMDTTTMVNFGIMLGNIGYDSVTFCPYYTDQVWTDTYTQLLAAKGNNFVSAIHLQCYSGGRNSDPQDWGSMIATGGGNTLLLPGLATNQANPGPWWVKPQSGQPYMGKSVVKTGSVAMYGEGDWSYMLSTANYSTIDDALANVPSGTTFFFYCNGYLDLGPGKQFQPGDAVFFGERPWWGSAPQCDAYSLSGGCSNTYNPYDMSGACPSDLQSQYAKWSNKTYPINGGFIWLYDSIVDCLLSNCCGEGSYSTAQVAAAYQQAIANGVTTTVDMQTA